jgi:hypothetical protein
MERAGKAANAASLRFHGVVGAGTAFSTSLSIKFRDKLAVANRRAIIYEIEIGSVHAPDRTATA